MFACFVIVDSIGLSKTGMLWDELAVATNGETYMGYLKNFDFSQRNWSLNDEHPPLGKYIYGVSRKITKYSRFLTNLDSLYPESRALTFSRFFSVLMGGLAVAALFLMTSQFFGRLTGFFAALFLATNPHFLAYTRIASLEMPLLLFSLIFIWSFTHAVNRGLTPLGSDPKMGCIRWVLVAVLLGASVSSRTNGFFLFFLFEAGLLLFYKKELFTKNHIWKIFLPALSLLFMYLIWPWLWPHPIHNFFESIDRGLEVHTKEYFLGKMGFSPFYYYFVYFIATTPLYQLFFFFVFGILLIKKYPLKKNTSLILFLFLCFLTPFLASFVPLKQDGIRYVQFFLPAFCILSAVSMSKVGLSLSGIIPNWFRNFAMVLVVIISLCIPLRFYPYYTNYYNGLFGSLNKIAQNKTFEMGWWGEGSLEAVEKVNSLVKPGQTVFVDFAPGHTVPSFIEGVKPIKLWQGEPDFIIVNLFAKWYGDGYKTESYAIERNYELIYEVKVAKKVTIVWVFSK
ncbi:hypothetical protein AUJ94_01360 [bacterium CG2_30_40_12]|nr:MAG: hypothetical protein AUJ94_01360 [bacterium CG2_30_40_12]